MNKRFIFLLALFMAFLPFTMVSASDDDQEESDSKKDTMYEIYPLPQHEQALGTEFTITDDVNVVMEDDIDDPTEERLREIIEKKSLDISVSDKAVSDKTNIMLGTKDSDDYVDQYFDENIEYDESTFDEIDPYVLVMDQALEDKGTIAILGDDPDAAYYGLMSLKMIFDQTSSKDIHSMMYEDYADTNLRGFIEGFYGFPWSHESRISLMEFGGDLKMNSYIFGPKDDKYHNSEWRELYPEDELEKIEELATAGYETKTEFIWAIHPGFNMIDWDDYDNEIDTLTAKLEQLYSVGVRQFGLFMDDISTDQALNDTEEHVKLVTDVANWADSKGDVEPLVYTPPFYNQSWTGEAGKPYLEAMSTVPDNVEIMWTGSGVTGTVNEEDMQWPKDLTERNPFVWLNWPVNDYVDARLMLGKGEVLEPGTHNISGVVTNPMEQAELSKIALFAVADFTWNVDNFDDNQSWQDSFKYIEPDADEDLKAIASHLSDPSPSTHGLELEESEYLKEDLNQFLERFENGEKVDEVSEKLVSEFDHVLESISNFKENSKNEQMIEEIEPWINSLEYIVKADKHAVESVMALQNEEINQAWEELAVASNALAESEGFTVEKLESSDITVEAGAKRLIPFAEKLIKQLDSKLLTEIDPQASSNIPITSYENQNMRNMVDGDEETFAYIQTIQENGDWYGLDLGKAVQLNNLRILQGRDDDDHDIFHKGILEYSLDGDEWEELGEEQSGHLVEAKDVNVEARYVRYRLTHAGVPDGKPDLWTAVREFSVNEHAEEIYTNVDSLKDIKLQATETSAELEDVQDITLKPSDYIGIELKTIEEIQEVDIDIDSSALTLEASENGVEWEEVKADDDSYPNAAYVRLVNQTDEDISFDLNKLFIELNKFTDPVISHNYEDVYEGELDNIFAGDLSSTVWFEGMQDKGNYVQVDMGGVIDVDDVAVAIDDGEDDYFREGDLQLSVDGESWETIHTFSNPDDKNKNFPDHEVPYRYKRVELDGQKARYTRLLSTEDHPVWFALNQIIVNEGEALPGTDDLTIEATPEGKEGYEASQSKDQRLGSFYTPKEDKSSGSLTYKTVKETDLDEVVILQNPDAISNANVTIRDEDEWHEIGKLKDSFNTLDTSSYKNVLEIKLEWDDSVKPQIHEIIPVQGKAISVDNVDDVKELVEQYVQDDAFKNEQQSDQLQLHLTSVRHYEKQENATKVVKHMEGFKDLLNHQNENELISENAYESLSNVSDKIMGNWQ